MTKQDIHKFLKARPSLSKAGICREAGVSRQLVDYILIGERSLTDDTIKALLPVMKRYGYKSSQ